MVGFTCQGSVRIFIKIHHVKLMGLLIIYQVWLGKILIVDNLLKERMTIMDCVVCVNKTKRLLIIYYFIVQLQSILKCSLEISCLGRYFWRAEYHEFNNVMFE